jgi:hypothetical protein
MKIALVTDTHFGARSDSDAFDKFFRKFYEEVLQDMGFLRIHRSHLINLNYVVAYKKGKGGFAVMIDGKEVEISSQKKQDFLDVFKV